MQPKNENDSNYKISSTQTDKINEYSQLDFLRVFIDNIDSAILSILAHRAQVVNYIIEYKNIYHLKEEQSDIRQEAINELLKFSEQLQLNKEFVRVLLEHLFHVSSLFLDFTITPQLHNYFAKKSDMLPELNRTLKHVDIALCSLLSERMQLVKQVGIFKHEHCMEPLAKARWEQVLKSKMQTAKELNINPEAIREFYILIHDEALRIESEIQ